MNFNITFLSSFKMNKILRPKCPFMFYYCCASDSSKSPKTIKIKNVGKGEKSSKVTKLILNTTNKVLYGPLLKKSSDTKDKYKELTKKSAINLLINKKYSDLSPSYKEEDIVANKDSVYDNIEKTNMNAVFDNPSSVTSAKILDSLSPEINNLVNEIPLGNPNKETKIWSPQTDFIYNISLFEGGYKELPSISKILHETMSQERKLILQRWEENMILKLGEDGFKNYKQALFDRGRIFHKCIEMKLKKEEVKQEQLVGIEQCWSSIKNIFPHLINIQLLESRVIHSHLQYQGLIDCCGFYKDIPVVIEFKTTTKPKINISSTYDNPLQLAAYIGAMNYDPVYSNLPNITEALLVIAYDTGLPAHIHLLSKEICQKYWTLWCRRFLQYQNRNLQNNNNSRLNFAFEGDL